MFSKIRIVGSYKMGLGADTELRLNTVTGREMVSSYIFQLFPYHDRCEHWKVSYSDYKGARASFKTPDLHAAQVS